MSPETHPNRRGTLRRTLLRGVGALAVALTLSSALPAPLSAQQAVPDTTLTVVPQADLAILDPVWTTAQITAEHAFLVYDTLFALDSEFVPQYQMLESHTVSDDGLTYTFVLRDGLAFSDGSPVEAADAVASIERWSVRSPEGKLMNARGAVYEVVDPKTFTLTLDEPFGMVEMAFGSNSRPVFVMREEEATTDAFEQVKTVIGSGPFVFDEEAWQPGSRIVYHASPTYVPRDEPADGFAGGKVAKVGTIEWTVIPDSGTAVNALVAGEVDMLEFPPHDLLPVLDANPTTESIIIDPVGYQGMLRPNSYAPPFDKPEARLAILHIVQARQEEYLAAMVGLPDYYEVCLTPFICGSPFATEAGTEQFKDADLQATVDELMDKAGYDGSPIVVLDPTDQGVMHNMVLVFAQHLRDLDARRAAPEAPRQRSSQTTSTRRRTARAAAP